MSKVGPLSPGGGGVKHALIGTIEQVGLATLVVVPVAVLTAVYLNEINGRLATPARFVIDAMSGLPSIIAGLLVYTVWVSGHGFSGAAGAAALAVLMLPTVTRASEEILRTIPDPLREGALALGAPRWQVTLRVVIPTALGGLVTAVILGIARAVGETAPMLLTAFGADTTNTNPFSGPQADLPLFVWKLIRLPNETQQNRAWAGALAPRAAGAGPVHRRPPHRGAEPEEVGSPMTSIADDATKETPRFSGLLRHGEEPATLDAVNISVWFGNRKVLERCSLLMEARKVTALIGPSGCGKSTFLRILNRMHEVIPGAQIAGRVELDGDDIYGTAMSATEVRTRIGMVFQKPNPFPAMTIGDNVVGGPQARAHEDLGSRPPHRGVPHACRPLGRGEGPPQRGRDVPLRWSAATPLHRPGARGPAAGAAHGRALLRTRPHLDAGRRRDDRRPRA